MPPPTERLTVPLTLAGACLCGEGLGAVYLTDVPVRVAPDRSFDVTVREVCPKCLRTLYVNVQFDQSRVWR